MSSESIDKALESDAPLTAAVHQRDVAHEAAEERSWHEAALVGRTITVNRPRAEVYAFWRDFKNLERFMENIERVDIGDDRRSHWVVSAPGGKTVEWDSRITRDEPDRLIAWESLDGADIKNTGQIEFRDAPPGRGTEVTATIVYDPPGGDVGKLIAKLFGKEPKVQAPPRPAPLQAADGDRRDLHLQGARRRPPRLAHQPDHESPRMRALTWHGKHDVRMETVPDPQIVNPRDAIIKITSTAICGSDLHLYDSYIPTLHKGDILGHEFMGEVVDTGPGSSLQKGQRVVVPFVIACGKCFFCEHQQFAACDNSNPAEKADMSEILYGYPMTGAFGYSHLTGGYAGGQAEYVRVPYSDVGPIVIPDGLEDDKVLFLSDILPTGWMAAENCDIEPGDTIAVWGCGPVGLFAIQSAFILGAHRVIAIDHHPHRLELARSMGAEVINYHDVKVREALHEMTGGIGPDACIDAVGLESHGFAIDNVVDAIKTTTKLGTDRAHVLREVILACRKGGRLSIPGVYGGFADKIPVGALMEKGLSVKSGQTHVQKYLSQLLEMIGEGKIDTTFLISHRLPLEDAPKGYKMFKEQQNEVTKVVLKPDWSQGATVQ